MNENEQLREIVARCEKALMISGERENLRDALHRLEDLILQQGVELRELRNDIRRLRE